VTGPYRPVGDRHIRYRLANYRSIRGMTQQDVAGRAGITREYVSMLEGGRRRADRYHLLIALAAALGVDVTALTTHQPGTAGQPPEQAATLRLNLHELSATVERSETEHGQEHVIVLCDGVLRIERTPGPDDTAKQNRNGALRIGRAIGAYLGRTSATYPDEGAGVGVQRE
jgi:transcriptional regulator with XRE-family HTH domain